ncbi:MAG: Uma2 family endonuclease, partial [Planctomycetia bacterium]|nr:Uma2 family endonuclease [Planctomycetia bacterium]
MTAVPKKKLTAQEYLAIERAAEFRSEFYNGEMFAMAGATGEHNRIKENF